MRYVALGIGVAAVLLGVTVWRWDAGLILCGASLIFFARLPQRGPWPRHPSVRP